MGRIGVICALWRNIIRADLWGLKHQSAASSESRDALEEVIEPYLLQQGLIQRTPRGRMLAQRGWDRRRRRMPKGQTDLFQ